jgi:hypothetical protein
MVSFTLRLLYPRGKSPDTHWIGGWVDPRADLDDLEKKNFLTLQRLELRHLGRPACSQSLYRLSYPGSIISRIQLTTNPKQSFGFRQRWGKVKVLGKIRTRHDWSRKWRSAPSCFQIIVSSVIHYFAPVLCFIAFSAEKTSLIKVGKGLNRLLVQFLLAYVDSMFW